MNVSIYLLGCMDSSDKALYIICIHKHYCFLTSCLLCLPLTGMDRAMGQRENLRWRKDLTQWRQTNDKQDKYVSASQVSKVCFAC